MSQTTFPCLEPDPVGGHRLSTVDDIYSERRRLEQWWNLIEADLFPEVVADEVSDYKEAVAESLRRVLELIAAGRVDPQVAARAALADSIPPEVVARKRYLLTTVANAA